MSRRNLHRNSQRLWKAIPIAAYDKLEEGSQTEMDFDIEMWSFINIIVGIKSWQNHSETRVGEWNTELTPE